MIIIKRDLTPIYSGELSEEVVIWKVTNLSPALFDKIGDYLLVLFKDTNACRLIFNH